MRKTVVILLLLVASFSAQSRRGSAVLLSKFGMAGGFTANYVIPQLGGLNDELHHAGLPEFSNGLFTYGGGGYVYVLFIPNLRLGGFGYGGNETVNSGNRSARLSLSGGGFTVEYSFPQIDEFALSLGAIIGGGKLGVDLYENNGIENWSEIWEEFNFEAENKHTEISSVYFLIAPTINVEILLNRFVALRIGGGYQIPIAQSWTVYDGKKLNGAPDNFNANGAFFSLGILVGLFVF